MAREKFDRKSSFYRPRRHSHKRGRVGKPHFLSAILHSDLGGGIHEISPAPFRPMVLARACPGPPSLEFSICFSDVPADNSRDVLTTTHGVDPSLALPTRTWPLTLDDASFTTKIAIHSGANVLAPFGCVVLLGTCSPQAFIRHDVLDRMLTVGEASVAYEQKCSPRSWGDFRESAPLQ